MDANELGTSYKDEDPKIIFSGASAQLAQGNSQLRGKHFFCLVMVNRIMKLMVLFVLDSERYMNMKHNYGYMRGQYSQRGFSQAKPGWNR